jgi:DNA-binding response OmpR family regulator
MGGREDTAFWFETCTFRTFMDARPKVLLVEDNADVRRLYAIGLNQRGFEVKLAANGAEAVDRVTTERPDYILLDWLMPLMDGSEVIQRLDAQHAADGVDIIVISGQPAPAEMPPRIRTWLTKPLTVDELVSELRGRGVS